MDEVADLQAQIVALRLAVEGAWLSLLNNDPDPVAAAAALKDANVAAVNQLDASTRQRRSAARRRWRRTPRICGARSNGSSRRARRASEAVTGVVNPIRPIYTPMNRAFASTTTTTLPGFRGAVGTRI